jgi:hypothetical protein
MLRELNEQASVLFDECLDEREHGTNVEATVRLLRRRRIRVSCAELALQPAHIIDKQPRHALQFLKPTVQVHASQDTNEFRIQPGGAWVCAGALRVMTRHDPLPVSLKVW